MTGFVKAERKRVFLKLAITGPSGSGKTLSALRMAWGLGQKVAVIDTENASAELYADKGAYDVLILQPPFTVPKYIDGITAAQEAGYDVLIIDSLTHEWAGEGGLLDQKTAKDARGTNSFANWAEISKSHERMKSAILQSSMHMICTMRSKMDYAQEEDDKGRKVVRKIGLAPVQREGMEYEFTTVFDVDMQHSAIASKDRTGLFADECSIITEKHGQRFRDWLEGAPVQTVQTTAPSDIANGKSAETQAEQPQHAADFQKRIDQAGYKGTKSALMAQLLGMNVAQVKALRGTAFTDVIEKANALGWGAWDAAISALTPTAETPASKPAEEAKVAA